MTQWTVLGGQGYVGSRLVDSLRAMGAEVWVPDREDSELWGRDLGHVVYAIGLTGDFRQRPFDTMEAHVGVLSRVLQRARFESLTYLSSTRVYMGSTRTDEDAPLTVQPADPSDLYNLSKLAGEALCHASGRDGVRVARLSNVVGPSMDPASGNFVASLIAEAKSGHIVLRSHPDSRKDYVHIHDVVEWLVLIGERGQHNVYNVASGRSVSHRQWAEWCAERFGCNWSALEGTSLQDFHPIEINRLQSEFQVRARYAQGW
jgi:nucleoside-diphosphate-sugar epimerase